MEPDFSGYATKAGLVCSDGRTIMPEAFQHQDKMRVPLVWQHGHNDINNVLGHAILEARPDGMYCQAFFNDSAPAQNAKIAVEHGDVSRMSIYAGELRETRKRVVHGAIKEVSLVLAGANPGALIDYIRIAHSDDPEDVEVLDEEAVITTDLPLELEHADNSGDSGGEDEGPTVQDVLDAMTPEQQGVVEYLLSSVLEEAAAKHADDGGEIVGTGENGAITHKDIIDSLSEDQKGVVDTLIHQAVEDFKTTHSQEGNDMTNVFEKDGKKGEDRATLSHDQLKTIVDDAARLGSLKESFLAHAQDYGIENIDVLFPDAQADGNGVTYISRRMEWVNTVLTGTKHSPFSRIKSTSADITADEARAKGYVKGNLKKNEIVKLLKRITTPKTIYKKQKLDRDDIVDITDLDIVAWLKSEMRLMLDEELARAILIGDGREEDDEDKIDEDHIRPIAFDDDMYNTTVPLPVDDSGATVSGDALVDVVVGAMHNFKGTGTPVMFTTLSVLTAFMLSKDKMGRRLYATKQELAAALMVSDIIPVEVMEAESDVVAVVVNLLDYTVGADAGGSVAMFDDFDIDYNQQKYLIETRVSGALTRPKAAITFTQSSTRVVTPQSPTFDDTTGVLTVPTQDGVSYQNEDTGQTFASGPQPAVAPGESVDVVAVPVNGFGFAHDADRRWTFTRDAS